MYIQWLLLHLSAVSEHKRGEWVLLYCIDSLDLLVLKRALTSGSIAITATDYFASQSEQL